MKYFSLALKHFSSTTIVLLFIWISFFPVPIQEKYLFVTKTFLIFAAIVLLYKKGTAIFKRSDLPLGVFLGSFGINVFFCQDKFIAFKTYGDLAIFMLLVYYLSAEAICGESKFNLLAKTICICSFFVAALGIFESLFAFNPLYAYFIKNPYYEWYINDFTRPMSTQFNPAPLGSYLLGCLPFNVILFKQKISFIKILAIFNIIIVAATIILTFSRSAFLGLIAMIIFYLFLKGRLRDILWVFTLSVLLIFSCFYLPYPFKRFGPYLITSVGMFSEYRINRLIMVGRILKDHPLAGLGFRNLHTTSKFDLYYPGKELVPFIYKIADNMYLTIVAETGIIGFSGFLFFIFYLFRKGIKKINEAINSSEIKYQIIVSLLAYLALLVSMTGYELFYFSNQYILFCILSSYIYGLLRKV